MMQEHLRFARRIVVMMVVGLGLMMAGARLVAQADDDARAKTMQGRK